MFRKHTPNIERQRGNSRSVIDFIGMSAEHKDTVLSITVDDTGIYGGGSDCQIHSMYLWNIG